MKLKNLLILTLVFVVHSVRHIKQALLKCVRVRVAVVVHEAAPVGLVQRPSRPSLAAPAPVVGVRSENGLFRFVGLVALDHVAEAEQAQVVDGRRGVWS